VASRIESGAIIPAGDLLRPRYIRRPVEIDAMPLPASGRRQAALAFILVTAVLDILAMGIIIPVLPALIEEFTGSHADAGWINGIFVALWAAMPITYFRQCSCR
jgi:hypothetical protein